MPTILTRWTPRSAAPRQSAQSLPGRRPWLYPFVLLTVLCTAWLAAMPAMAADLYTDPSVYRAQVPVKDNSDAARSDAVPTALAKVLVRVTGDPQIAQSRAAKAILSRASQLMRSYSYVQLPNGEGLQVSFDPSAVNSAVKAQNLPLWGGERPKTLVWLAIRGPNGRRLVSSDDAQGNAAGLVDAAQARGVPLIFPLMDLQDQRKVQFSDVWGGFEQPVEKASQRYPRSDILMASASGSNGQWKVQWTLLQQGQQPRQWQTSGDTLDNALSAGGNDLANFFARRFAVVPNAGSGQAQNVVVENVQSVQGYASILSYLSGLTAIKSVRTASVDGNRVTLRVDSDAAPDYLQRVLGLSGLLTPVQGGVGPGLSGMESGAATPAGQGGAPTTTLYYRLSS